MKKLYSAALCLVLVLGLGCACAVEKQAVIQVEKSHEIISKELLRYVNADPKLSAKDKEDWAKLVESDRRNMEALKKGLE